ncbi:MAG TPA: hypothetical protein VHQ24_16005, partial [Lachnospiraceae bacterium]|nr:hypothetical protein [Lachnospiraceae bacterium]
TVMPIGVRNTDKWLRGIASLVGKETFAEEIIEKEHERILPEVRWSTSILVGQSNFLSLKWMRKARILIENQLKGIKKVASAGITVKVNSVLVPGINEDHIEEIAKTVSEAGASIYNIIPLIPQHELADAPAPTCAQIDEVRTRAGRYIDVFRHCQRCRADAIGIPGESDFGDQIYQQRISHKDTFSHG